MAADSPRRGAAAPRSCGQIIRPIPASDKSVMDSVVDFIHDVVPQACSGTQKSFDEKDIITWVKFESSDINDLSTCDEDDPHNGNTPPLLMIVGYTNGIQVWVVPANGEAQEVLSWKQGSVRVLRVLPSPDLVNKTQDLFVTRRPLVAICDSVSAGPQFCCVSLVSLRTGDQVMCLKFKSPVVNIHCNKRVMVVCLTDRISVFDASSFKEMCSMTSCYPSPGPNINPIALGSRWLAYADQKLVSVHQTCGGVAGGVVQSYTATVIHAAKTLTKGLTMFSETVASSLAGVKPTGSAGRRDASDAPQPGIVTIVDVLTVGEGDVNVHEDSDGFGIIAHFPAHSGEPVAALEFDPSGSLLFTADKTGHNFHIFRILPHPESPSLGAVHHLYTLYRGDTTAKVQDVSFSLDSRWVAVSTLRGTTHIFPISPYGGPITVRTHTSPRIVNRLSRFHKSAGLDDMGLQGSTSSGRNSPVLSVSPGSAGINTQPSHPSVPFPLSSTLTGRMGNPRLPPYPHPTVINPSAQIRQVSPLSGFTGAGSRSPPGKPTRTGSNANLAPPESIGVAATFAPPRAWLVGSPSVGKDKGDKRAVDSLYVVGSQGHLFEYLLEPRPAVTVQKASEDNPIDLDVVPRAQWLLGRSGSCSEVKPPLLSTNPLIIAQDIVTSYLNEKSTMTSRQGLQSRYNNHNRSGNRRASDSENEDGDHPGDTWLSQVEILTHAGPHRRLWMGPQFTFRTFNASPNPVETELLTEEVLPEGFGSRFARSNPVAIMPTNKANYPLLIEAAPSSLEQSPRLVELWQDSGPGSLPPMSTTVVVTSSNTSLASVPSSELDTEQLREDLADAMLESPHRDPTALSGQARIIHDGGPMAQLYTHEMTCSADDLTSTSTCSSSSGSGIVSGSNSSARPSPQNSDEQLAVFSSD